MDVPCQHLPHDGIDDVHSLPHPQPAITDKEVRQKYIDDQVQGELLRLDTSLCQKSDGLTGPRDFHDRNGLENKEDTLLQKRLNDISLHTKIHKMKINIKKTKIIAFNFTKKFDFIPNLTIDGRQLDVTYTTKLLGIIIQSDCKWGANTKYIVTKAKKRVWFLRRLKTLGASKNTLIDVFQLFVRSVLEMAVPLWAGSITKKQSQDIEAVQITCMKIISSQHFTSYEQSLQQFGLETLVARRESLCLKFAKKCIKSTQFKHWFPVKTSLRTRSKEKYIEPSGKTKRYLTSSIPHLIKLLNKQSK